MIKVLINEKHSLEDVRAEDKARTNDGKVEKRLFRKMEG